MTYLGEDFARRPATGAGTVARRGFLAGAGALSLVALSGCATVGETSYVAAVRRLLQLATSRAFTSLTAPDGFWDSTVARIELPTLFGNGGAAASALLRSTAFREELQHQLNRFAESGAKRAAPIVAEAVRNVSIADGLAIIRGGNTGATTFLRTQMGPALVNAMLPELDQVMRASQDSTLNRIVSALAGVSLADAAHALSIEADNAIWYEVGQQEASIRANPEATNDAVLIAALKLLG